VVNYQTSDSALKSFFSTVNNSLRSGGLFAFDSWHGPAVLNELPSNRVKTFENNSLKVVRKSTPTIKKNINQVDVHFNIDVHNKLNGELNTFEEVHSMRYLFKPEIEKYLNQFDLSLINTTEWLSDEDPSERSWNVFYLVGKK